MDIPKDTSRDAKLQSRPLVSIITPAYNRARFLDETIYSVLSQEYRPMEYIVIDDGSTDDTRDVLAKYGDRIVWWTHENMGETRTVNKGLRICHGEIITVVNSDDPLLPGAIRRAVAELERDPDLLAVYSDWVEIGPDSKTIREIMLPDYDLRKMLTSSVSLGPGTFFRRRALDMIGVRDTRSKYAGDLDYWFRLAMHGPLGHIPELLATHRTHPGSLSSSERGSAMAEELVHLVRKVYENPGIQPGILRIRRRAFSHIHFTAASYCEGAGAAARAHYAASFAYSPVLFVWRFLPMVVVHALARMLPKPLYERLRACKRAIHRITSAKRRRQARDGDPL